MRFQKFLDPSEVMGLAQDLKEQKKIMIKREGDYQEGEGKEKKKERRWTTLPVLPCERERSFLSSKEGARGPEKRE